MSKLELFAKLKNKGIFWSYSRDITLEEIGNKIFVEYLLKYADFDDIKLAFELFEHDYLKEVWLEKMAPDQSFVKTNLMIARVFFGMDIESDYFGTMKNARAEKLRVFAS